MKKLIIVLITLFAAIVVHAEQGKDAERFAKMKEIKLQGIDGRLSASQQERSCVNAAATNDAVEACAQASRQAMKEVEQQQKSSWASLKNK
jgi:hypothetical protein